MWLVYHGRRWPGIRLTAYVRVWTRAHASRAHGQHALRHRHGSSKSHLRSATRGRRVHTFSCGGWTPGGCPGLAAFVVLPMLASRRGRDEGDHESVAGAGAHQDGKRSSHCRGPVSTMRRRAPLRQRGRWRGRERIAAQGWLHRRMAPVPDGPTRQLLANSHHGRASGGRPESARRGRRTKGK